MRKLCYPYSVKNPLRQSMKSTIGSHNGNSGAVITMPAKMTATAFQSILFIIYTIIALTF